MNSRRGARVAVALAVAAALLFLLGYGLKRNDPSRSLDNAIAAGHRDLAPAIALPTLDSGRMSSLAAYRGKVVVVNFWASWCGPCQAEAPLLQRWYGRIRHLGGVVLGIDSYDVTSDANGFIKRYHLSYPMVRDEGGRAKQAFGVTGYPESFVIDRTGHVAALQRGPVTASFMRKTVIPLLGRA